MKKYLVLCLLVKGFLFAQIVEIFNISEINKYVTEDCLASFDLDNTLFEPIQEFGSDQWFCQRILHLKDVGLTDKEAFDQTLSEWHSVQLVTQFKTVEHNTKKVFDSLKSKRVIGVTARNIHLVESTLRNLQSLDLNFFKKSLSDKDHSFDNGRNILFTNGIIFADGTHKGKALFKFLDLVKHKPKSIVFIDDKKKCLLQVEETCKHHGIEFTGLRYSFLDEKVKSLSKDLVSVSKDEYNELFELIEKGLLLN